jgi:hypothetical protein
MEGLPRSYTGDSSMRDETSSGEAGGGGDPDGEGCGVSVWCLSCLPL